MRAIPPAVLTALTLFAISAHAQPPGAAPSPSSEAPREAPTPTPAPTTADDWHASIHQGMAEEGSKTGEQRIREQAEESAFAKRRANPRFFVAGGLGFGTITLVHGDINIYRVKAPALSLGAGVRLGLSSLWQFQVRGTLDLAMSAGADCYPSHLDVSQVYTPNAGVDCSSPLLIVPSIDATFRVHMTSTSPIFVGFGPRVGVVAAYVTSSQFATDSYNGKTKTTSSNTMELTGLLAGLLELGALLGPEERFEVAARPYLGMQTAVQPEVVAGANVVAAYAF